MKRILIVGKSFSGLTSYLENNGYDYFLLKDRDALSGSVKDTAKQLDCDFSDRQRALDTVEHIEVPIDGIMTVYENYVLPAAWIGERLSLPFMPVGSAEACTDKELMRTRFAEAPEKISPDFAVVTSEDDVAKFAERHSFPLILKPANLVKSLLVTKNDNLDELLISYRKTNSQIDDIYKKYAPNRKPKLLIEEFLVGSIHSVEAFVDKDGKPFVLEEVVDYRTGYDIGYDDNFHYSRLLPSNLNKKDQSDLRHCAQIGMQALDMKATPAHVEIIMTSDGPRIVEIGARSGGYRARMHGLANGIDIPAAGVALALGQEPQVSATKEELCAVLEIFPKTPGKFMGIKNQDKLEALPSLNYLSIKTKPGQHVGKSSQGYKMCAIIILHHSDPAQFERDLDFVDKHIEVTTDRV